MTQDSPPQLLGGRHLETGKITFPCPADLERFEPVKLPRKGKIWSWTVQRFRPKTPPYTGPEKFEPYAVGYIELPDTVIVESRLVNINFDDLNIGLDMELTLEEFGTDEQGNKVMTFAFEPCDENIKTPSDENINTSDENINTKGARHV